MRRSAQIAVAAHVRAMRAGPALPGLKVMAELLHEFHRHHADISYHPIVGGGPNACILHYHENSDELRDGDLLLIDAGCEIRPVCVGHHPDVPGERPVSAEQKAIYDVVLEAQEAAIASGRDAAGTSRTTRPCAPSPRAW